MARRLRELRKREDESLRDAAWRGLQTLMSRFEDIQGVTRWRVEDSLDTFGCGFCELPVPHQYFQDLDVRVNEQHAARGVEVHGA